MNTILVVQELIADVKQIKKWMRGIPSRFAGGGSTPETFKTINGIIGGSNLWTSGAQTVSGIKYDGATSNTTVPNANPSTPGIGTFPVGLGRGTISGIGTVYVSLRPNPGTGVVTALQSYVSNGSACLSVAKVQLPVAGFPLILRDVYLLFRFV